MLAVGAGLALALWGGLWIRAKAWQTTLPIHFTGDLGNAHNWGRRGHEAGYLRLYDSVKPDPGGGYGLDYPPLRLLIVTQWVKWLRATRPDFEPRSWGRNTSADFDPHAWPRRVVRPLLQLNLAAELATALAIFLLVRAWSTGPAVQGDCAHGQRLRMRVVGALGSSSRSSRPGCCSSRCCRT